MKALNEADLKPQRKYIFWVEGRRNYNDVAVLLRRASLKRVRLFVGNSKQGSLLGETLASLDPMSYKVLPFSTVDPDVDEDLYRVSQFFAEWFCKILLRTLATLGGHSYQASLLYPLSVAIMDRIVSALRPVFAFAALARQEPGTPILISEPQTPNFKRQIESLDVGIRARLYHLAQAGKIYYEAPPLPLPDSVRMGISAFGRDEIARVANSSDILMVSNLHDKQYRFVCEQILGELCIDKKVALFSTNTGIFDDVASPALHALIGGGNLSITFASRRGVFEISDAVLRCFNRCRNALLDKPPFIALPSGLRDVRFLVAEALDKHALPTLDAAHAMIESFCAAVEGKQAVVVSPGRYLGASTLVAAANALNVPSIELQGGVIASSRRFLRPNALRVLAMDPASAEIYTSFLGLTKQSVEVVGSARVDQSIKPARGFTQAQAREQAGLSGSLLTQHPLLVLATQPVGVPRATIILQTVLDALCASETSTLVIKTHPNEGPEYLEAYAGIIARYRTLDVTISTSGEAHHFINSADIILTFFSTMGLEAFALDRSVIAINPFKTPPPFDLAALGVAMSARSSDELTSCIRMIAREGCSQFYVKDPRLSLLKDGYSCARIRRAIVNPLIVEKGPNEQSSAR